MTGKSLPPTTPLVVSTRPPTFDKIIRQQSMRARTISVLDELVPSYSPEYLKNLQETHRVPSHINDTLHIMSIPYPFSITLSLPSLSHGLTDLHRSSNRTPKPFANIRKIAQHTLHFCFLLIGEVLGAPGIEIRTPAQ
jgi:hypothetical protein